MAILYSTGCPKCKVLKKKLDETGIEYTICEDKEVMAAHGFSEVPVFSIGGVNMLFKDSIDYINKGVD